MQVKEKENGYSRSFFLDREKVGQPAIGGGFGSPSAALELRRSVTGKLSSYFFYFFLFSSHIFFSRAEESFARVARSLRIRGQLCVAKLLEHLLDLAEYCWIFDRARNLESPRVKLTTTTGRNGGRCKSFPNLFSS